LVNVVSEKCWRLIPSRYPPISVFERVASPEDFELLYALESLTNDRLREASGNLSLVAPQDRVFGLGAGYIMAAFTHLNPKGSRFSDGSWGVYYAAKNLDTAIAETQYHSEKFMRATNEPAMSIDMRVLVAKVTAQLHDLTGEDFQGAAIYDTESYQASQNLARQLKLANSDGVLYWSVRHTGGQNVGVFRPPVLANCTQERHLEFMWDGAAISTVFEKKMRRI
jgi:hypothetical protein